MKLLQVVLKNRLILGRQRSLLFGAAIFARVPLRTRMGSDPLAIQIRIFRVLKSVSRGERHHQRCRKHGASERASLKHGRPPRRQSSTHIIITRQLAGFANRPMIAAAALSCRRCGSGGTILALSSSFVKPGGNSFGSKSVAMTTNV